METYHNATSGKYELLTMAARVESRSLAAVEIVDLRRDFQQTHRTSPISKILHDAIAECLSFQTQALILINRRGYSWSVLCRSCGASVQCANCSISMTYHKNRNRLECHYCGYTRAVPKICPKCDSKYIYFFGEGSEHLEERLRKEFPGARIARLDRDTVRTKKQYQETLGAFAGGAAGVESGVRGNRSEQRAHDDPQRGDSGRSDAGDGAGMRAAEEGRGAAWFRGGAAVQQPAGGAASAVRCAGLHAAFPAVRAGVGGAR
jgi:primosomal protein N' (replication factor Y)